VKIGEVRGRINAALAGLSAPAARPRRRTAVAPAPVAIPRYEVRWPQERWQVQWPATAARLTLAWPH
jgi:hypothetical protein